MFRFTIRDVFWLTVVVAMGLGWIAEHWQHAATIQDLNDANKGKASAETGWQHSAVEHNKTLQLIEESGLTTVTNSSGKTTLQKIDRLRSAKHSGMSGID